MYEWTSQTIIKTMEKMRKTQYHKYYEQQNNTRVKNKHREHNWAMIDMELGKIDMITIPNDLWLTKMIFWQIYIPYETK